MRAIRERGSQVAVSKRGGGLDTDSSAMGGEIVDLREGW